MYTHCRKSSHTSHTIDKIDKIYVLQKAPLPFWLQTIQWEDQLD